MSKLPSHRRLVAVLVAALAVGGAAAALAPARAGAASNCQVSYRVDQWPGGFVGYVDVTAGTAPVHGWTVTWTYTAGQRITSFFNAQVSQTGAAVTATSLSWNADLAANATTEFGVQGTWSGGNPAPTDFAVTGSGCAATVPSAPPSTPSRPSTGPSPSVSPSAGPPPGGCGAAVICDGFENQPGGSPSGDWTLNFPNCSGAGTATIDSTVAHAGGKSLKVAGAASYCNHVFVASTKDLSAIGPVWYARFYVRHTTALPAAHVTFAAMRDAADGNNDLRMGGQNGALQWNRQSDDATLPAQSPAGVAMSVPLPTGVWSCVEFKVDGSTGTMDTWLNGTQVAGLHNDGVPTQDVDAQWLARGGWRPRLADFRLGWESYGEGADTLWYDDVALGPTRIGC